jgi:hypothetical protein
LGDASLVHQTNRKKTKGSGKRHRKTKKRCSKKAHEKEESPLVQGHVLQATFLNLDKVVVPTCPLSEKIILGQMY